MTGYAGRHRAARRRRWIARPVAALGLLASTSVAGVMLLPASPAAAQAPGSAAWWNAANLGDPAPAPPAPPDVKSGDLFVQGSNAGPANTPLAVAPATTQAVAGVSFDLPKGAAVGALALQIDGTPPPQVSVLACRTKEPFTSAEDAPWSEVPAYDANACTPGALKGTTVVFADVSKLAAPTGLSVLILPGPLDRVVFKHPGSSALAVTKGGGIGAGAPPVGTGAGAGSGSSSSTDGAGAARDTRPAGSSAGGVIAPVGNLPATGTTTTPGSNVPPVVAQPGATPTAAQPATASSGMSTKERRLIALLIIAAEVLGYVLLRRIPGRQAAPVADLAAAGGRLRAPDRRAAGGRGAEIRTAQASGVGRFRRDRHGPVPHL